MNYLKNIPESLLIFIGLLYALLIISSAIVRTLQYKYPGRDFSELAMRIKSWWIMILIFSLAILLSRSLSLVFMAFISFLALKEYLSLITIRRADRRVLFWAYLAIPFQYYWIHTGWYGMFIIFIPVYVFLLIPVRMLLIGQTKGFLTAVSSIHWGMMITVFGISHAAYLIVIPDVEIMDANGPSLLFYLVALTQLNDVAQYVWGKLFGKHAVVPLVSPKKTWEGLAGGVTTTVLLSVLISQWLTPMSYAMAVVAGLIIGLGGFIGDINISAIKRDIGIKDSGNLIPGHGGILDRIDSLSYTAPLFFHFIRYFY